MTSFKWFASLVVAATAVFTVSAQTHCPGNVASITPRIIQGALIVIPVKVNNAGPFDFIVDTGSQITVIDPALAGELRLKLRGSVGLVSVSGIAQGSVAVVDLIEADKHAEKKAYAVVQDLGQFQAAGSRIRGVLGESFLSHFDLLIDYRHKLVCLDETSAMRESVRGEHISLVAPQRPAEEVPFMDRLIISAHLSGTGKREILLQLDSGSDGPVLYTRPAEDGLPLLERARPRNGNLTEAQKGFADLPPQEMWIGQRTLNQVPFVTPVRVGANIPRRNEDGLLPTLLFQRIFICAAEHYVVFEPR